MSAPPPGASSSPGKDGPRRSGGVTNASSLQGAQALPPVPDVDPETQHRNNMVASTFANLELQTAQATLRQYAQLYETAIAENQRLADMLKDRDRDAMQVVEFLRGQLEQNEVRLREANLRLERAEEDFMLKHGEQLDKLHDELGSRNETIQTLREQLAEANTRLDELAHFEQDKQQLTLQIARLKEAERDLILAHEKEVTKIKFQSLEEKVKLRAVEKAMGDKFEHEVNERAMLLVDTKTQQIRESNIALTKMKAQLEREVARLTTSVRSTSDNLEAAKREAELARESHSEYAKQGCKLTRVARDATKRVRELETRCSHLSRELETQKLEAGASKADAVGRLREELEYSQNTAAGLKKQLEETRLLAAEVLNQRSELEAFFYDAIAHCRTQQGKPASGGDTAAIGSALDTAMTPRALAGYRGDLDARVSVKHNMVTKASTTRPAAITQALTPRGTGTFLASEGLERPGTQGGGGGASPRSLTPRGTRSSGPSLPPTRGGRPMTREALPQLPTAARGGSGSSVVKSAAPPPPDASHGGTPYGDHTASSSTVPPRSPRQPDVAAGSSTTQQQQQSPAPAGSFAALSWEDKEKIIAALLLELNRHFYGPKQPLEPAALLAPPPGADRQPTGPLPEQQADEEIAEWGGGAKQQAAPGRPPSTGQPASPMRQSVDRFSVVSSSRGVSGTPASAVAFPSSASAPGSARGARPPQPPPTAPGGQRISRQPSDPALTSSAAAGSTGSRPPTGGGTPSASTSGLPPARPALRRSQPSSARSSAGSRRATFAPNAAASTPSDGVPATMSKGGGSADDVGSAVAAASMDEVEAAGLGVE